MNHSIFFKNSLQRHVIEIILILCTLAVLRSNDNFQGNGYYCLISLQFVREQFIIFLGVLYYLKRIIYEQQECGCFLRILKFLCIEFCDNTATWYLSVSKLRSCQLFPDRKKACNKIYYICTISYFTHPRQSSKIPSKISPFLRVCISRPRSSQLSVEQSNFLTKQETKQKQNHILHRFCTNFTAIYDAINNVSSSSSSFSFSQRRIFVPVAPSITAARRMHLPMYVITHYDKLQQWKSAAAANNVIPSRGVFLRCCRRCSAGSCATT